MLKIMEKRLLESDFEGIMRTLKNSAIYVSDEEELVTEIYEVSFPTWVYEEIPLLESDSLP
jgi:hypothetical protein